MLELKNVKVVFNENTSLEKVALNDVSIQISKGDFVTILGGNGAGKSTFFNTITGSLMVNEGSVLLDGEDITLQKEHVRSKHIGRLFQNPEHGTASSLSVEENLALAYSRNRSLFSKAVRKDEVKLFKEKLQLLDMGLENRLKVPIGLLSGGQRQAVALMMAVVNPPKLLLLDEHTAALDPKSAKKILSITKQLIEENQMTALMITHNIKDALEYGNRLLIFNDGKIIKDFNEEEKKSLSVADVLEFYEV